MNRVKTSCQHLHDYFCWTQNTKDVSYLSQSNFVHSSVPNKDIEDVVERIAYIPVNPNEVQSQWSSPKLETQVESDTCYPHKLYSHPVCSCYGCLKKSDSTTKKTLHSHYKAPVNSLQICNLLKTYSGSYNFDYYIICKDNHHHKNYLQLQNVQNIPVQPARNQTATQIFHHLDLFLTHLKST